MTDFILETRCSIAEANGHGDSSGLEKLHQQFLEGDRSALLVAIRFCSSCQLVMPEWVSRGLGALDNSIKEDCKFTLDNFFGYEREVTNRMQFEKIRNALDNEVTILILLIDHRIGKNNLNLKAGELNSEGIRVVARDSEYSVGQIDIIYKRHQQWLLELDINSPKIDKDNYGEHFTVITAFGHRSRRENA